MNLFQSVDLYCERLTADFFAEPLNLLSNLAFIVAGLVIQIKLRRLPSAFQYKKILQILNIMVFVIGCGSALFHSFANIITQAADVVPIAVFIFSYIVFYFVKVQNQSVLQTTKYLSIFMCVSVIIVLFFPMNKTNGSSLYIGTCGLLLAIYIWEIVQKSKSQYYFGLASVVFVVSLTFRGIDQWVCQYFSYGTHFLWHSFNGLLIYFVMMGAIERLK